MSVKFYPPIIHQIHKEFNTASELALAEAKTILSTINVDKANRLTSVGFIQAQEARALTIVDQNLARIIERYMIKYPNHKFITESQVEKICKKYHLVCGPIAAYTGFVPEVKLREIESFRINAEDRSPDEVVIKAAWNTGAAGDFMVRSRGAAYIHNQLKMDRIPADHPACYWQDRGKRLFSMSVNGNTCYIEKYDVIDRQGLFICAPKKEMKVEGLKKIGSLFSSLTTKHYPDPVVLQPVKGGFLIVASWGDEASDEIVVNQRHN